MGRDKRKLAAYLTCGLAGKGSSRRAKNEEFEKSIALFTADERREMDRVFNAICKTGDAHAKQQIKPTFGLDCFQAYIGEKITEEHVISRLFTEMADHHKNVTFEAFVITMSKLIKGTLEQQCQITMVLASGHKDKVTSKEMYFFISDFIHYVEDELHPVIEKKNWDLASKDEADRRFSKYLLRDLFWRDIEQPLGDIPRRASVVTMDLPAEEYTQDDILRWLTNHRPRIPQLIAEVFRFALGVHQEKTGDFGGERSSDDTFTYRRFAAMIPVCKEITFSWDKLNTLLEIPCLMFLNHHLPGRLQAEWRLLFSSRLHGESFNTMAKDISNKGPTLLIVRDTDGHVFGGFAGESWKNSHQFYGSATNFLFGLKPVMELFDATGKNTRYQYINQKVTTLPNGLGMGGHFEYFGLWLDGDFGTGHSMSSTTYSNEQLSNNEQFDVDCIEVWGVGPPPPPDMSEFEHPRSGSILDSNPEASALLDLTGSYRKSEGLRETDGSPGVKTLPLM